MGQGCGWESQLPFNHDQYRERHPHNASTGSLAISLLAQFGQGLVPLGIVPLFYWLGSSQTSFPATSDRVVEVHSSLPVASMSFSLTEPICSLFFV
jgi:hypothetical protein